MFADAFEDHAHYRDHPPDDSYLEALLASGTFLAIAAVADARVVGALTGYVLQKYEQSRSEFYLYDLAVSEAWRRQGVATALIEALRQEAARRGFHAIFVQADREDEPAIALYAKLGIGREVLHFDIPPASG